MYNLRSCGVGIIALAVIMGQPAVAAVLHVEQSGGVTELNVDAYPPFHTTEASVSEDALIELSGPSLLIAHWEELDGGVTVPYYSYGLDGGQMGPAHRTSNKLHLRYTAFDPLDGVPEVPQSLNADPSEELYVIQFYTLPLDRYRSDIESFGGVIHGFLRSNALVVQMDSGAKTQFDQAALAYVR